MSRTSGIKRIVQLFWDKDIENTDLENSLVVLGRSYTPQSPKVNELDTKDQQNQPTQVDDDQKPNDIKTSLDDVRNYFSTFQFATKTQEIPWPTEFLNDVYTRLWFTYRVQFSPLQKDPDGPSPLSLNNIIRGQNYELNSEFFTTDCGWGCMIRTAQSLLANALVDLKLGRDWRFAEDEDVTNDIHNEIVSWFIDDPSHIFSIHRIVDKGKLLSGKKAGEWFGPSAAARSIQALCTDSDVGLNVYIGSDSGDIYEQDFFKTAKQGTDTFTPTLILLGVRLGIENVNPLYWQSLKDLINSPQSVGISGGRPSSSHYFFGYQGDYFFYLDPHLSQPALKLDSKLDGSVSESTEIVSNLGITTVHTKKFRKIHINEVDPSMLLGILIRSEDEWYSWRQEISSKNNRIVHISPDHSPHEYLSNRKPSFIAYGDDFIDVGLEYDEFAEDGNEENVTDFVDASISKDIGIENEGKENNDDSVVILPTSQSDSIDDNFNSLEQISSSIKDEEFEKVSLKDGEKFDDATTIEIQSINVEEDPYIVSKDDVLESKETQSKDDWESEDVAN